MEGSMEGQTDRQTDRQTDDGWMDGCTDGYVGRSETGNITVYLEHFLKVIGEFYTS
jgi:hypothetical protein